MDIHQTNIEYADRYLYSNSFIQKDNILKVIIVSIVAVFLLFSSTIFAASGDQQDNSKGFRSIQSATLPSDYQSMHESWWRTIDNPQKKDGFIYKMVKVRTNKSTGSIPSNSNSGSRKTSGYAMSLYDNSLRRMTTSKKHSSSVTYSYQGHITKNNLNKVKWIEKEYGKNVSVSKHTQNTTIPIRGNMRFGVKH